MRGQLRRTYNTLQYMMQCLALAFFAVLAAGLVLASACAFFGVLPWVDLYVDWNGAAVENAGMYAQLTLTFFALTLVFFLPTNQRIMVLENSHRRFSMGMQDVARAYAAVHTADRTGVFRIPSEFDSVRERLKYLRDHPHLHALEPTVLEVAAQMSHVSRDLAEVYSDERVSRARDILFQRHQEIEDFNERLIKAKAVSDALKNWSDEVDAEEQDALADFASLQAELKVLLPELAFNRSFAAHPNVVELPPKAAE